jgi:hypothetical protein
MDAGADLAAPRRSARDEELMATAAQDPAVQEALDLFNGKVVSVRAPENGEERRTPSATRRN